MSEQVLVSVNAGVLEVTINRPNQRNALNAEVSHGIAAAMDRLDGDDSLRCAILTGAGGYFCAGMDLKAYLEGNNPLIEGRGLGGITQWTPKKPIIAAIDGFALAGGLELALGCDMLVAHRDARLGIPEAKRGLVAGAGGVIRLARSRAWVLESWPARLEACCAGPEADLRKSVRASREASIMTCKRSTDGVRSRSNSSCSMMLSIATTSPPPPGHG